MTTKRLVFGFVLPLFLTLSGAGLAIYLQIPEPEKSRLANPNNEGEMLEYLPAAEVARVKLLNENLEITASGTVVPFREIQLAAQVVGRIVEKSPAARSGNYVEAGETLFKIDPRDYLLEQKRLQQRIDQEEATIAETKLDIENTASLIEVAKEQLDLAEAEVKRFTEMKDGFSSQSELDTARRAQLTAKNQYFTLKNQKSASEKRLARMSLAKQLVETELEQATLNLERTEVKSLVAGRVVADQVEADSFVQRGTPLVTIEDTEKVEVQCNIRMDQLAWILEQPNASAAQIVNAAQASRLELPKTKVEVSFSADGRSVSRYAWEGRLDRINGAGLDLQSRTIPIRILVEKPRQPTQLPEGLANAKSAPMLVRGMFVEVKILPTPTTQLLLVPKLAIKPANEASVVWKFAEDRNVVRESVKAKEAIEAYQQAVEEGMEQEIYGQKDGAEDSGKSVPNPEKWDAGMLQVVPNVRMVTAYWDDPDYWVCQADGSQLAPGDVVIVTPLPGMKADGTDAIRVPKGQPDVDGQQAAADADNAAGGEELVGKEKDADPS